MCERTRAKAAADGISVTCEPTDAVACYTYRSVLHKIYMGFCFSSVAGCVAQRDDTTRTKSPDIEDVSDCMPESDAVAWKGPRPRPKVIPPGEGWSCRFHEKAGSTCYRTEAECSFVGADLDKTTPGWGSCRPMNSEAACYTFRSTQKNTFFYSCSSSLAWCEVNRQGGNDKIVDTMSACAIFK